MNRLRIVLMKVEERRERIIVVKRMILVLM
jgi:hypothetical protein